MGLLDWLRRPPAPVPEPVDHLREVWGELGHHGADIETLKGRIEALRAEWDNQRELLRKLVQRLEKRDQRAADTQEQAPEAAPVNLELEGQRAVAQRVRRNGLLFGGQG